MRKNKAWLEARQKGIGGSDVAAIMGANRWMSSFQVYTDKTEEVKPSDSEPEAAYFGSMLKDLVAKEFTKRTGKKVRRDNKHLAHAEYPFMLAHIDRRVVGENAILLCKTCGLFSAKEWEGEAIPNRYILQAQHYIKVTETEKAYIAVLIGGQKLVIREVNRDDELIDEIIKAESSFWNYHVVNRIPPELDSSEAASNYLKDKYYGDTSEGKVKFESTYEDKIIKYITLKNDIKNLEAEAKEIENNLKNTLGNAEEGISNNFLVVWRQVISNRVDSKSLKNNYPDVYKAVCKESTSRRFEVKELLN